MRHVIERHKLKIAIGLPALLLVASSLGFTGEGETLEMVPEERFIAVNSTSSVEVSISADEPINVISGTVLIPAELDVLDVSTDESVVDLWQKEPKIESDVNIFEFSGGIIDPEGFSGDGVVFTLDVQATESGEAELTFEEASVLAHDGVGTNVLDTTESLSFVIRPKEQPSPDLNKDNRVGMRDFGILARRMFTSYDPSYDLNSDGDVTIGDLLILIKNFRR